MQSIKKHRKPKVDRVNAKDFAIGFAANAGGKDTAFVKAQSMVKEAATPEVKNFWENISGHITKFAK